MTIIAQWSSQRISPFSWGNSKEKWGTLQMSHKTEVRQNVFNKLLFMRSFCQIVSIWKQIQHWPSGKKLYFWTNRRSHGKLWTLVLLTPSSPDSPLTLSCLTEKRSTKGGRSEGGRGEGGKSLRGSRSATSTCPSVWPSDSQRYHTGETRVRWCMQLDQR